jgi:hypothetical protein
MEGLIILLIIFIYLVLFVWNKVDEKTSEYIFLKSNVDGKNYYVQKKFNDHQEACDLLAAIKLKLDTLIVHLEKNFPNDVRTKRILEKFDTSNLIENDSNNKFTSYTQNKGEKMYFCLRTRNKTAQLHSLNLMVFVAIHELAHVCSVSVGHSDPEFWDNFAFLLKEAVSIKVWKYKDFQKYPTKYCGMTITNSVI